MRANYIREKKESEGMWLVKNHSPSITKGFGYRNPSLKGLQLAQKLQLFIYEGLQLFG